MMLYKLLSEANRERFDPVVVSLRNRGLINELIEGLGVPIHSVAMRLPLPTPTSCWRLIQLVRRLDPDLIQGWMYHGNLAAQVAAVVMRRASVVWNIRQSLNGFDYEKPITAGLIKLSAHLSSLPAKIIYNSRIAAAQHSAIGYNPQKSLVIPNGFMTSLFVPSREARRSVRAELGVPDDTILLGLIGRYHPVKDHSNFLRAAELVLRSYPGVHFLLCGNGVNWVNSALVGLVDELKMAERIHLLDERQDMVRITAALDIATSSSSAESFPNVVGEAMSSGVPCVVTDVSDLLWIIGETGRIVPPNNAQALADAMIDLIQLGSEGRRALGMAARKRVIEHFQLKEIESLYETLYEEVVSQQASKQPAGVRNHAFGAPPSGNITEASFPMRERSMG